MQISYFFLEIFRKFKGIGTFHLCIKIMQNFSIEFHFYFLIFPGICNDVLSFYSDIYKKCSLFSFNQFGFRLTNFIKFHKELIFYFVDF